MPVPQPEAARAALRSHEIRLGPAASDATSSSPSRTPGYAPRWTRRTEPRTPATARPPSSRWSGTTPSRRPSGSSRTDPLRPRRPAARPLPRIAAGRPPANTRRDTDMAEDRAQNREPSGAERTFGDLAPALVHFTDDVLFGEAWTRPQLSPKERSLVTVAALTAGGNTEQLVFHLGLAKQNGATEEELIEAITHLAFYAGWPKAMSAMAVAKQVFRGN